MMGFVRNTGIARSRGTLFAVALKTRNGDAALLNAVREFKRRGCCTAILTSNPPSNSRLHALVCLVPNAAPGDRMKVAKLSKDWLKGARLTSIPTVMRSSEQVEDPLLRTAALPQSGDFGHSSPWQQTGRPAVTLIKQFGAIMQRTNSTLLTQSHGVARGTAAGAARSKNDFSPVIDARWAWRASRKSKFNGSNETPRPV